MGLVSHCPWVLQAAASFVIISSMEIVPSLTVSSETDLSVRLLIPLRYVTLQLTGHLDIAISIVNEVSLCDLGWKGRNGCKCNSKKREPLIKHDWDVVSFELWRGNINGIKIWCLRVGTEFALFWMFDDAGLLVTIWGKTSAVYILFVRQQSMRHDSMTPGNNRSVWRDSLYSNLYGVVPLTGNHGAARICQI